MHVLFLCIFCVDPGLSCWRPPVSVLGPEALYGLLQAEFEAGFERGGQTREHAQLAKTLGVAKLIVAVQSSFHHLLPVAWPIAARCFEEGTPVHMLFSTASHHSRIDSRLAGAQAGASQRHQGDL